MTPAIQNAAMPDMASAAPGVLLIEDDFFHSSLVKMLLTRTGFRCVSAVTALEAAAALETFQPELVIADWDAEGLDGCAIVKQLQGWARLPDVPRILMTDRNVNEPLRLELALDGYEWILRKPIVATSLPRLALRTVHHHRRRLAEDSGLHSAWQAAHLIETGCTATGVYFQAVQDPAACEA